MMTNTETIVEWLEEAYNSCLSVYDYNDKVRITNGSAAHYVDVYPQGTSFVLEGEKYGETVNTSCDAEKDALLELMSGVL